MKPNQVDRDQIADLILTDPDNGDDCYIMTPIEPGEGTSMTFEVCSKDNRYKVTLAIEEV
jgi:hypothetical protein